MVLLDAAWLRHKKIASGKLSYFVHFLLQLQFLSLLNHVLCLTILLPTQLYYLQTFFFYFIESSTSQEVLARVLRISIVPLDSMAIDPMDYISIQDIDQKPPYQGDRRGVTIWWKWKELVISDVFWSLKYARDFLPRFCACSGAFQKNDELITWDEEFAAQHIKWSKQNPSY